MASKTDWIQIEREYRESGMSYQKLAKKYGVSLSTLKKVAARNHWAMQKDVIKSKKGTKKEPVPKKTAMVPLEPGTIVYRNDMERRQQMFDEMVEDMAHRIENALTVVEDDNVFAIKMLAAALKDLRGLMNIRDPLDVEEQRLRIEKLKSEIRGDEVSGESGVIILPAIDQELEPPGGEDG